MKRAPAAALALLSVVGCGPLPVETVLRAQVDGGNEIAFGYRHDNRYVQAILNWRSAAGERQYLLYEGGDAIAGCVDLRRVDPQRYLLASCDGNTVVGSVDLAAGVVWNANGEPVSPNGATDGNAPPPWAKPTAGVVLTRGRTR